jgi:hypothetical protein
MNKVTIYGERCSGTNYLEKLIATNFDVEITWQYGWKHFFGFNNLNNADDTLFIGIVRNPFDWINSFFQNPYHLSKKQISSIDNFLYNEVISYHDDTALEILQDRNIYNNERYNNIIELRNYKIKYLLEDMPLKVKNYIFIRYEDLINDFTNTMIKIQNYNLKLKLNISFPQNIIVNVKNKNVLFEQKQINIIPKELIINHPSFNGYCEKKLQYI